VRRRLDGPLDEPRPEMPRTITDADVERELTIGAQHGSLGKLHVNSQQEFPFRRTSVQQLSLALDTGG
jgi:hypothetical protein